MKKIALFLIVLSSLVVVVGCNNNRKSVTRFTPESDASTETAKTPETIIKLKDTGATEAKPTPIELKTEKPVVVADAKTAKPADTTPFEVTSLSKNLSQSTKGYQLIEGTTPASTAKILVNDFPLSKYKAGETKWSYIAAVSLGNLKTGDNKFTVKAVDSSDNELGSKTFTITYKGVETAALASTGSDSMLLAGLITFIAMGLLSLRRRNA